MEELASNSQALLLDCYKSLVKECLKLFEIARNCLKMPQEKDHCIAGTANRKFRLLNSLLEGPFLELENRKFINIVLLVLSHLGGRSHAVGMIISLNCKEVRLEF